MKVFFNTSKM